MSKRGSSSETTSADLLADCEAKKEFMRRFTEAVHRINTLQKEQLDEALSGDLNFGRFDILLNAARAEKDAIKYEWIEHADAHGCGGV